MVSSLPRLFITGVTGYVGSHVLEHAVQLGYPVKAAVRHGKEYIIEEAYGDKVHIVSIDDIATMKIVEELKDVDVIIHIATTIPLSGTATKEEIVSSAVDGTLNIVHQAVEAGVKRAVVTTSFATSGDALSPRNWSDYVFSEKDWNPLTREDISKEETNTFVLYQAAKTVAERELWKFADEHPEIDITTISPPNIYGPLAKSYKVPKGNYLALGTVSLFYRGVFTGSDIKLPAKQTFIFAINVDVRDVARAHILACESPLSTEPGVGQKRILLAGSRFTMADAVKHLLKVRPELANRLPDPSEAEPQTIARIDNTRAKEILKLDGYIPWEKTVEDTADAIIALEKSWQNETQSGFTPN